MDALEEAKRLAERATGRGSEFDRLIELHEKTAEAAEQRVEEARSEIAEAIKHFEGSRDPGFARTWHRLHRAVSLLNDASQGLVKGQPKRFVHGHNMRPAEERFWAAVEKQGEDGCWLWRGATGSRGYGDFWDGRTVRAHRWAYEALIAPIPEGLTLDHLCRNRACVNPAHLEPVTSRENILRGEGVAAGRAAQTHCKRGHPLTPENVYVQPSRPNARRCRRCDALRRAARHGNEAARAALGESDG